MNLLEKAEEKVEETIEEVEEKMSEKEEKPKKKRKGLFLILLAVIFLVIIIGLIITKPGEVQIEVESSLREVLEISDVSTVEYTYNSIATVKDTESKKEKIKYHVSYEGIVKAGFDFEDVTVTIDEENKVICVNVPQIKIISTYVVPESMDFIFNKSKYETETVYQEAYGLCEMDLKAKGKNNAALMQMAQENAVRTMKALCKPWELQLPEGYSVEYK